MRELVRLRLVLLLLLRQVQLQVLVLVLVAAVPVQTHMQQYWLVTLPQRRRMPVLCQDALGLVDLSYKNLLFSII